MSSACICHLQEYCFHCEVYLPLERKFITVDMERDELRKRVESIQYDLTSARSDLKNRGLKEIRAYQIIDRILKSRTPHEN